MKKYKCNECGITLIVLVITIVILLILSGITISSLTNTGLFNKANTAVENYKTSQLEEKIKLAKIEAEMYDNKSIKDVLVGNGTITKEQSEQGIIKIDDETCLITNYNGIKELSNKSKNGEDFTNQNIYILDDIDCHAIFNKDTGELQEGENFEPIANFNGTLNGNGYKIKNLYVKTETDRVALISTIKESGIVKNLVLDNAYIEGNKGIGFIAGVNCGTISDCISQNAKIIGNGDKDGTLIGGICGTNRTNGKISNCVNKSEIVSMYKLCGGICGYNLEGNVENCTNYGKVTGNCQVGGIVGDSEGTQDNIVYVSNCTNYGEVNEEYNKEQWGYIGGIVGCNYNYSNIINCINKAEVKGASQIIGGISGINHYNINNCNNEGKIEETRNEIISATKWTFLGGICGFSKGNIEKCGNIGDIKSNYNINDDSDGVFIGGICGAISCSDLNNIFDNIKISKCYNYGTVNGLSYTGGITGRVSIKSSAEYCFNNGDVVGKIAIGGISGNVMNDNSKIISSYNIGKIKGNSGFGGICGALDGGYIENSYNVGKVVYDKSSKYYGAFLGTASQGAQCKSCYYLNVSDINGFGYDKTEELSDSIIGKSADEIKKLTEILGNAYVQNDNINNGYPYLKENEPTK